MKVLILAMVLFGAVLLVAMAGCAAAWVSYQDYEPSPNICRSDEIDRTDCIRLGEHVPAVMGVAR